MDALSHALIAYILFSATGFIPLVPFAILGAVILDADIFFPAFSDSVPSLYLFTHGGIAHSIVGAVAMSLLAYLALAIIAIAGIIPGGILIGAGISGYAAILTGSFLHLAIDIMACPGLPLLAPVLDRKYTLGILPGPSILLAAAAVGSISLSVLHVMPFWQALMAYAGIAIAYFVVRIAAFLYADTRLPVRKVPSINPFRWLVIREDNRRYTISTYTFFKGYDTGADFCKCREATARDIDDAAKIPEVRRFLFHSYCVTAERIGSVLILADPVREKGYVYYPPKFKRVAISSER